MRKRLDLPEYRPREWKPIDKACPLCKIGSPQFTAHMHDCPKIFKDDLGPKMPLRNGNPLCACGAAFSIRFDRARSQDMVLCSRTAFCVWNRSKGFFSTGCGVVAHGPFLAFVAERVGAVEKYDILQKRPKCACGSSLKPAYYTGSKQLNEG